jgi:NADH-quinone oxidoreductase subunit A
MESILAEYLPILVFLGIGGGLSLVMVVASYIVARQRPDTEKASPYECGFEAFDDARSRFDVRFYLVAILFIIFDLEVAFLFPFAVAFGDVGAFGFWSMVMNGGRERSNGSERERPARRCSIATWSGSGTGSAESHPGAIGQRFPAGQFRQTPGLGADRFDVAYDLRPGLLRGRNDAFRLQPL